MKSFVMSLLSLSVLLSLTACGTEVKTEEYYSKHLDEAEARKEECSKIAQKKRGRLSEDEREDCNNAYKAWEFRSSK